jgi:hypothetical protein
MGTIITAITSTPAGQILDNLRVLEMARSVASALGLTPALEGDAYAIADPHRDVRNAFRELVEWAPELGYRPELAEMGARYDEVGFAETADEYENVLNTGADGLPLPFLGSDMPYYAALGGRENGRTLSALLSRLRASVGELDP